jgi:hypothetical protein
MREFDIIRAERRAMFMGEGKTELSSGSGAMEFVAEVLEVFWADFELQNFLDHRREVRQRSNRTERWRIGWSRRTPRRSEYQRILNDVYRHAAVIKLSCKQTIRTAQGARGSGRRTICFENQPNKLALLHRP